MEKIVGNFTPVFFKVTVDSCHNSYVNQESTFFIKQEVAILALTREEE